MKMTTMIAAMLASTALMAASTKEMLDAGDYAGFARHATLTMDKDGKLVTLANAPEIYDVYLAATNYASAGYIAGIAYNLGDKSMLADLLNTKIPATFDDSEKLPSQWMFKTLGLLAKFSVEYTNPAGVVERQALCLNQIEPSLMLAFYKRMKAAGSVNSASGAFCASIASLETSGKKGGLSKHITPEWQEFLDSFTPEEVQSFKHYVSYSMALNYFRRLDLMAKDPDEPKVSRYWSPETWKRLVKNYGSLKTINSPKFYYEGLKIAKDNSKNVATRIACAIFIDKKAKTKEASASIYGYVVENGTWSEAASLALYLNDSDKILDVYKKIGTDATADQINAFIPIVNALDYNYRSAEVLDILKNINAKYTLKLYDDRDTWEPILSKIRAMIDAR